MEATSGGTQRGPASRGKAPGSPPTTTAVYIVAESTAHRDGLRVLLERKKAFSVCGTAGTLHAALTEISHADLEPSVAVVDGDMVGDPGAVEMLRGQVPGVHIVPIGLHETDADVLRRVATVN